MWTLGWNDSQLWEETGRPTRAEKEVIRVPGISGTVELAGPDDWQCNAVERELDEYSEHSGSTLNLLTIEWP